MNDKVETKADPRTPEQRSLDRKASEQFEGNFLDSADIQATGDITLTISEAIAPDTEKDAKGKLIDKWILGFAGAKKRMILGKTNRRVLCIVHGKQPSAWTGKKVTLTLCWLKEAFGEPNVPVVRIALPEGKALPFGMRKHYGRKKPYTSPS